MEKSQNEKIVQAPRDAHIASHDSSTAVSPSLSLSLASPRLEHITFVTPRPRTMRARLSRLARHVAVPPSTSSSTFRVESLPLARLSSSESKSPKKAKRDLTNAVVVESIRRKKLAKGIVDDRLPPPSLCVACGRRFCRCETRALERPREPLESDCCQSAPACTFCVKVVYAELLEEYEGAMRKRGG